MNLAPMRYANIDAKSGGPIELMEAGALETERGRFYQVNASLAGIHNLNRVGTQYFSPADGTGVDRHLLMAQYKAISEALERWAYHYLVQIGYLRRYGFDVEPTTTGMAAYPGLFEFQARRRAKLEAEERFCINRWWHGHLGSRDRQQANHRALEIENPLSGSRVALVWKEFRPGRHAYGTAAGRTWDQAHAKAWLEMELMARALNKGPAADLAALRRMPNSGERQLVYFSLEEGHSRFQQRLKQGSSGWSGSRPQPIIDCLIPGPWQAYTTVWRVVYPMVREKSDDSLDSDFLY